MDHKWNRSGQYFQYSCLVQFHQLRWGHLQTPRLPMTDGLRQNAPPTRLGLPRAFHRGLVGNQFDYRPRQRPLDRADAAIKIAAVLRHLEAMDHSYDCMVQPSRGNT